MDMEEFINRWLFDPTVGKIVLSFIGILIINALARFLRRSLANYIQDSDARYKARKSVTFLGYVAAILLVATVFSDHLGGLTVAFGVAGAGIAFALQEVIVSVAGWVAISFGNFFEVGDRVQLGGTVGDVIDIGVLRTTLMEIGQWVTGDLYNGRIVRIANSFVFKEPVFNYSADFPFLWDEIAVPVKYGCDHHLAREILQRVAQEVIGDYVSFAQGKWKEMVKQYAIEHASVEPMVTLIANDNWMEFTVRYVVDFKKRRSTKDELFERILDEFEKTDGQVALASATFQLVEAPAFKVQLTGMAQGQQGS
jgi:small-conductance mechanosensitive channel